MLTVEKIGGTSMTRFHEVLSNIILKVPDNQYYHRIFVVSAYGGVTNMLLEHKKTGVPGIYEKFVKNEEYALALDGLLAHLIKINETFADIKLDLDAANTYITQRIQQTRSYLESMGDVIASGYVDKQNILLELPWGLDL